MKHPTHKILNAAYLFYYASDVLFGPGKSADDVDAHDAKSRAKLGERLNQLVEDVLSMAHQAGFDVLNALTCLDNNMFLQDQKVSSCFHVVLSCADAEQFGAGDGFLVRPLQFICGVCADIVFFFLLPLDNTEL